MSDRTSAGTMGDMSGQTAETARKLYDASGDVIQTASDQAQETTDQLARFVREQPLSAALAALIIGYLLGKMT